MVDYLFNRADDDHWSAKTSSAKQIALIHNLQSFKEVKWISLYSATNEKRLKTFKFWLSDSSASEISNDIKLEPFSLKCQVGASN